ncbi:hypothetical protein [Bacillus toyonensis]|uniref:hypothetical protein n=1 Tax=Bacillus toyonensis TaxID=155322 RepID=UPI002E1C519E|nr:hypothetical protein [Bacillus toyonensis]
MEQIEIHLDKLFASIRRAAENTGNLDSFSDILTINQDETTEFSDMVLQAVEEMLEGNDDTVDEQDEFMDEDTIYMLNDNDDEDDEDDDE